MSSMSENWKKNRVEKSSGLILFAFNLRCVITELFTDGTPPFDLSLLLNYRIGEYSPWKILEKIEDSNIRVILCVFVCWGRGQRERVRDNTRNSFFWCVLQKCLNKVFNPFLIIHIVLLCGPYKKRCLVPMSKTVFLRSAYRPYQVKSMISLNIYL